MKLNHVLLIFLLVSSCSKNKENNCFSINDEALLFDKNWQIDTAFYDQSIDGYTAIYNAVIEFDNMKIGFKLNQNNTSEVLNAIGFCGTPPYSISNGSWVCDGKNKILHTYVSGCISDDENKMEIISLSDNQLEIFHTY